MEKILLDELSNIISAYKEGKDLQFYTSCGEFKDVSAEEFDLEKWYKKPKKFRIKSEPKYRPFKDAKECWVEMCKHHPFGWVKTKSGTHRLIVLIDEERLMMGAQNTEWSYRTLFDEKFTFVDGTPFGVKVEE